MNDKIKEKNLKSIQKDGEYYSVVSLCIDERGEFLFIRYNILFIDEFYEIVFVGSEKGLIIKGIKDDETFTINNGEECLSLCFDKSKTYLFAGFKNGIIKVFKIFREKFI